ncbi:MAG: SUMF1/EgtB/PvdO family nonheme iron enzyme, partial [Candidatus Aenigmarchaeota archaeon]|nr:SUMF1/EgtB/PvdO family nonheme iron enzyme [Candidatus Aenigmarchaeota archaeon]
NPYTWEGTFDRNKANVSSKNTIDVGSKTESDSWCGASDMIGNAAEVCYARHKYYLKPREETLVTRGGSYQSNPFDSRTTSRHPIWYPERDDIGFRLVVELRN